MNSKLLVVLGLGGLLLCSSCGTTGSGEKETASSTEPGKVKLSPIESRIFNAAHYDRKTKSLTLQFNNDATYRYAEVPKGVYKSFLKADDKGDYYRREIRTKYTGTYLLD